MRLAMASQNDMASSVHSAVKVQLEDESGNTVTSTLMQTDAAVNREIVVVHF